jgi:hypothetical protein
MGFFPCQILYDVSVTREFQWLETEICLKAIVLTALRKKNQKKEVAG